MDRLAHLVDDLFELSRINAGALRLTLERVSLAHLVSDALAGNNDALARSRGVRLAGYASAPLVVAADSRSLSRAITNLVVNAIRHTLSEGTVEIRATEEAGQAVLAVSDGCGGLD